MEIHFEPEVPQNVVKLRPVKPETAPAQEYNKVLMLEIIDWLREGIESGEIKALAVQGLLRGGDYVYELCLDEDDTHALIGAMDIHKSVIMTHYVDEVLALDEE